MCLIARLNPSRTISSSYFASKSLEVWSTSIRTITFTEILLQGTACKSLVNDVYFLTLWVICYLPTSPVSIFQGGWAASNPHLWFWPDQRCLQRESLSRGARRQTSHSMDGHRGSQGSALHDEIGRGEFKTGEDEGIRGIVEGLANQPCLIECWGS